MSIAFKQVEVNPFCDFGDGFPEIVQQGESQKLSGGACVPLIISKGRCPACFLLKITPTVAPETMVYYAFGGKIIPSKGGAIKIQVSVKWKLDDKVAPPVFYGYTGRMVPETRCPGKDNVDVIFLEKNGRLLDIQVGLISRRGKFFVTTQDIFCGWITKSGFIIPQESIHNYPGCDYGRIVPVVATHLKTIALRFSTGLLETAKPPEKAKWQPPLLDKRNDGRANGVVTWFNLVTGTGIIQDREGRNYFVHFSNIYSQNGLMECLEPMTRVSFLPSVGEKGRNQALKVVAE